MSCGFQLHGDVQGELRSAMLKMFRGQARPVICGVWERFVITMSGFARGIGLRLGIRTREKGDGDIDWNEQLQYYSVIQGLE